MKKTKVHNDRSIFDEQIRLLKEDPEIQKMASFTMHNGNTTLQHVENVADVSFRIAEKLGIDIDEKALARGAMLHDYYLYTFIIFTYINCIILYFIIYYYIF